MFSEKFPCSVTVNLQFYFKVQALANIKKLLRLQIAKFPRSVTVNLQFYFKVQALANIKKIVKASNCQILAWLF